MKAFRKGDIVEVVEDASALAGSILIVCRVLANEIRVAAVMLTETTIAKPKDGTYAVPLEHAQKYLRKIGECDA